MLFSMCWMLCINNVFNDQVFIIQNVNVASSSFSLSLFFFVLVLSKLSRLMQNIFTCIGDNSFAISMYWTQPIESIWLLLSISLYQYAIKYDSIPLSFIQLTAPVLCCLFTRCICLSVVVRYKATASLSRSENVYADILRRYKTVNIYPITSI